MNMSICHSLESKERALLSVGTILIVGCRGYNSGIILCKIQARKGYDAGQQNIALHLIEWLF